MFEYCKVICNFFNNYGGYMTKDHVKNLIFCIFGYADFESEDISNEKMEKINDIVISDMQDKLYEEIYFLYKDLLKNEDIY